MVTRCRMCKVPLSYLALKFSESIVEREPTDLLSGNQAHVDSPDNASQCTHKVASFNSLNGCEVDDAYCRPELPPSIDKRREVSLGSLPNSSPVDAVKVQSTGRRPVGNSLWETGYDGDRVDSCAQGVDVCAEEKSVHRGTNGLI